MLRRSFLALFAALPFVRRKAEITNVGETTITLVDGPACDCCSGDDCDFDIVDFEVLEVSDADCCYKHVDDIRKLIYDSAAVPQRLC